ncbi:MAG: PIN domain-containing protein [Pseudomonadota bacterium]
MFDTGPFVSLFRNFYPSTFVTLWENFGTLIEGGEIVSTREVFREIEGQDDELLKWAKDHKDVFTTPTADEGAFVSQIYAVAHFQANIEQQKILKGGKNADPFVVAKAAVDGLHVVTLEKLKPHAAKVPNICGHFNVSCLSLEEFMQKEGWKF